MRNKISMIIVTVIFLAFSRGCISDYIKGGDKEAISNYEKMIADSSVTIGILDSVFTEQTIEIAHIPLKTYEFKYYFKVDDVSYSGKATFDSLPKQSIIKIHYLKNDPGISSTNPKKALYDEKEKETSSSNLIIGIIWGILGILGIFGIVAEFKKKDS
jgi:hypothetical protein